MVYWIESSTLETEFEGSNTCIWTEFCNDVLECPFHVNFYELLSEGFALVGPDNYSAILSNTLLRAKKVKHGLPYPGTHC